MRRHRFTTPSQRRATEISPDTEPGGLIRLTLFMLTLCLFLALVFAFLNWLI